MGISVIFINMERNVYIYGLYDINVNVVRYVGKSLNVDARLRGHLNEKNRIKNHKNDWVSSVLKKGSKINYKILEVCGEKNWKERERFWIIKLRKENDLVNYTNGGDGEQTNRFIYTYEELKKWVIENKPKCVNSISTFKSWVKTDDTPTFLPICPQNVYKNYGWISWGDFLDTNKIQSNKLVLNYLSYNECKKWVRENLTVTSRYGWKKNIIDNALPIFIPNTPEKYYKNKGWVDWFDFLGKEKNVFLSHDDSKNWIKQNYNKINVADFKRLCKDGVLPSFIPRKPYNTYKDFVSWFDFLGGKGKRNKNDLLSFDEAINIVHTYNIKSNKEWRIFIKEKTYELKIPTNPDLIYKNEWVSWYDWLGKNG